MARNFLASSRGKLIWPAITLVLKCNSAATLAARHQQLYGAFMHVYITHSTSQPRNTWLMLWCVTALYTIFHDDVIKWKHFPRYWPFVREIYRSPVNPPQNGQWRGALMFSVTCAWINGWVNNCEAGDLRRHRAHYDVIVMLQVYFTGTGAIIRLFQCQWRNMSNSVIRWIFVLILCSPTVAYLLFTSYSSII